MNRRELMQGAALVAAAAVVPALPVEPVLDDYEEGTFTIWQETYIYAYAGWVGRYTRVGRIVEIVAEGVPAEQAMLLGLPMRSL